MRRIDHKDIAAIVALINAPITLTYAAATYMGYAVPFGKLTTLTSNQRVAAALVSSVGIILLLLAILFVVFAQINRRESTFIGFTFMCLAVLVGGVVLVAFEISLLDPILSGSNVHSWLAPIVVASAGVWVLSGLSFYLGFGEGPTLQ